MRTEEWEQDEIMVSTALVHVYEPGDVVDRVQDDTVMLSYEAFRDLMTTAGFEHARTS